MEDYFKLRRLIEKMGIENWYNAPFMIKNCTQNEDTDFRHYDKQGNLICTQAHDGRKQKKCCYYYRNAKTRKCLFLESGGTCEIKD